MGIISLAGLEFQAHHGVYAEERERGNTFMVDISIETNTSKAEISDQLEDTLDYVEVFDIIQTEMNIPSNLLEHVGYRIIQKLKTIIGKGNLTLTIYKKNPTLGGICAHSAITLTETI